MAGIGLRQLLLYDSFEALTGMLHRAFAPLSDRELNCSCLGQTVQTTRHRVVRALLRAAESRTQETARLKSKTCKGVIQSKAVGRPAWEPSPYPWPARHPAELALLAKSAHLSRRRGGARAGAVDRVAASASGAVGSDLWRR